VIVENIDGLPLVPYGAPHKIDGPGFPVPPAPIVIGNDPVPINTFDPEFNGDGP
jgi:hypothetical protein